MSETTPNTRIEKNGLTFNLVRDETKGKKGSEGTTYWNIPSGATLAGLTDAEKQAIATDKDAAPVWRKVVDTYVTLFGADKVVEYVEARKDVAMRTQQLGEDNKDVLTMDEKLAKAIDFIAKGDFGRNRQSGIGVLAEKLSREQKLTKIQAQIITTMQALMVETDSAKKAVIQAELLKLMSEQGELNKA